MSEPMSSCGLRFIYNSLLLTTSTLTARKLSSSEHTYAYAACMVGGAVAVIGLLRVLFADAESEASSESWNGPLLRHISRSVLELAPLPLINMQLYEHSLGPCTVVLAHGIFVLPLVMDLGSGVMQRRKSCDLCETLRDLCMLGNIVSLGYLAAKERNFIYMRMTIVAALVKYYPVLMHRAQEDTGDDLIVCGSALLFHYLGHVARQWALQ